MESIDRALTTPNWSSAALVTIDVQNDFTNDGAPARIAGTENVLPSIAQCLSAFRALRLPILHVIRLYARDGSNAEISRRAQIQNRGPIAAPETEGAELVRSLKPGPSVTLDAATLLAGERQRIGALEWIMYKPRWGAFYRTALEVWLHELKVDTLIVCGCNFPNCPRATLVEASERDFRTVLISDATSMTDSRGLAEVAEMGVTILRAAELLAELERSFRR